MSAIVCTNLEKTFKSSLGKPEVLALKGVSFQVPRGSVSGLLGPNGSGKSTLIKVATGLIFPSQGEVTFFNGQPFSKIKSLVGFVPEKPVYPGLFTGREILGLHAKLACVGPAQVEEFTSLVKLESALDRPFKTYSKGMQQRLAIAQALLSEPELLILDEPLSGLDPDGREDLIQVILDYAKKENTTVLLSSHLLADLERICNHLVVLKQGELLFCGNPGSLFDPDQFEVQYRVSSFGSIEKKVLSQTKLPEFLKFCLDKKYILIQVCPKRGSISQLYFELIQKGQMLEKSVEK